MDVALGVRSAERGGAFTANGLPAGIARGFFGYASAAMVLALFLVAGTHRDTADRAPDEDKRVVLVWGGTPAISDRDHDRREDHDRGNRVRHD